LVLAVALDQPDEGSASSTVEVEAFSFGLTMPRKNARKPRRPYKHSLGAEADEPSRGGPVRGRV